MIETQQEHRLPHSKQMQSWYQVIGEEITEETNLAEIAIEVVEEFLDSSQHTLPAYIVVTASDGSHPDGSEFGAYADGRFFIEGNCLVTVPPGITEIFVKNGPNYIPLTISIDVTAGHKLSLRVFLYRWYSPEKRGWYSGDNHVHSQHDRTAKLKTGLAHTALQGRANGLSFLTEAGSHVSYENMDQLSTVNFLLKHADETRMSCFTGHFNTPGITAPLTKAQIERINKQPLPAQALKETVHELGGIVSYTHPLSPPHQLHWMGATAIFADAVLGKCADTFDVDSKATELLWFSALNLGNKLACSSYTDSCLERLHTLTPGDRRVYCHATEFSYEAIVDALRQGHTFATNGGPVFAFFTIGAHQPGDTILVDETSNFQAEFEIHSLYWLKKVELYRKGLVVCDFDVTNKAGEVHLTHSFQETEKSWYVLRVEDEQGNWCITSPLYFEPAMEKQSPRTFASAILFEISNHTRFIQLRRNFFAHLLVTVSTDDPLAEVKLLKNEKVLQRMTPGMENELSSGYLPVTELEMGAPYSTGWIWHFDAGRPIHLQADLPVAESGWYSVRVMTESGQILNSDRVYFDNFNPYSHELSVAHLAGENTKFDLRGYGEEMLLADIQEPYEDRWWYPNNACWTIKASFGGKTCQLQGGGYHPSATSTDMNPNLIHLFKSAEQGSNRMNFKILSYEAAMEFKPNEDYYNVMIRIVNPKRQFEPLKHQEYFRDILELKFLDYTEEQVTNNQTLESDYDEATGGYKLFSEEDAKKIVEFFDKHKGCDLMAVHCHVGKSRSAAVGVGWCKFNQDSEGEQYIYTCGDYFPNKMVVEQLESQIKRN